MIPKPRINLLVYHGVFAPHAHARKDAVHRAREDLLARTCARRHEVQPSPAARTGQHVDGETDGEMDQMAKWILTGPSRMGHPNPQNVNLRSL
jgi:hypothetical protein